MPRNAITGVFALTSNSFNTPVAGTTIDPVNAQNTFNDLVSGLNSSYVPPGVVTLEQYGGSGDGTTDNVAAFTALLAASAQTLWLGSGKVYKFASALPTITYGLRIIGDTMSSTVLDFYQTTGSCLHFTGSAGGGGAIEGLSIRNKSGATLTNAILLEAQSGGGSPDYFVIRDVVITGATNSDLFQRGLFLDGSARTTGTVGIRDIDIDNIKIFNCTVQAFETSYAKDVKLRGSCFATGTGGVNSGKISGVGASTESNIVRVDMDMGDLALDYCVNVVADGIFNAITTTANSSYFTISGKAVSATINASSTNGRLTLNQGATITNNSTSTFVMDRSGVFLDAGAAINFSAGDVTIQHNTNALTITGASNGFFTEYLIAPSVSDGAALGSTLFEWSDLFLASGGIINWNNSDVRIIHAANALTFDGASNGFLFTNMIAPSASDGAALGSTSLMWSDLFLASGSVVNWNNGDVTLTHSADTLAFAGGTTYSFDANLLVSKSGTSVLNGISVRSVNTSSGETHTSTFQAQDNGAGTVRALFAAAGPLNAGVADQGEFDILNENGTIFMAQLSSLAANGGARLNLYDRSSNTDIRLDTNALSWFRGGPLEATELRASSDVGGAASQISHTNTSDLTANSTGVGSIKFKGTTSRDSSGFVKIYVGTTAYYVPVFSAISG